MLMTLSSSLLRKELIAELYLGIYMDYFHNDRMLLLKPGKIDGLILLIRTHIEFYLFTCDKFQVDASTQISTCFRDNFYSY
jgi:hypothetical protein